MKTTPTGVDPATAGHAGYGRSDPVPPPARRRWGLRALGFLGLALLSMITAVSLGHYTLGTLGSLVLGLVGAAYSSAKGFRVLLDDEVFRMIVGRRRR